MADTDKERKQPGLGGFLFIGSLVIGLGVGIGFPALMPSALIIGFGVGLIAMGTARSLGGDVNREQE